MAFPVETEISCNHANCPVYQVANLDYFFNFATEKLFFIEELCEKQGIILIQTRYHLIK